MKTLVALLPWLLAITAMAAEDAGMPIRIVAPELARIDFKRTDGGLAQVPGLKTFVVFRADREHPELSDGRGWTYHHHPDLACWQGLLYAGWSSCEKDEDTGLSRELYKTSADGEHWSPLAEMFPVGLSTPLRMYFFHAPNGRMLAIAGYRTDPRKTDEKLKGPLVVREIRADHTLGGIYTLRAPERFLGELKKPRYDTAGDAGFVEACRQLLADHLFLEQQDYGVLLDAPDRIKWRDPAVWEGDAQLKKDAADFGKAMSFFRRADGALVSVGKFGWTTVSRDDGKTWAQPVKPPSLVTGWGKVLGQRVRDDRYILVYDPDKVIRYPLVLVTGADGITFTNARVIHGELPAERYPGLYKDPGASYVRGLSAWSNDGSRKDDALWFLYSVNKEDIWISKVPLAGL